MRRTQGRPAEEHELDVEQRLVKMDRLRSRRRAMTVPKKVPVCGRGRTSLRDYFLEQSAKGLARLPLCGLTKWDESDGFRDLATIV